LSAGGLRLFLIAVCEMRLQQGPPALAELGPFLPAEHGTRLWDVTIRNEGVLQTLRVIPNNGAEEVIQPLQNHGMIAGEMLQSQIGSLAAHGLEEHRRAESSVRRSAQCPCR
jgi:hypothetical protein